MVDYGSECVNSCVPIKNETLTIALRNANSVNNCASELLKCVEIKSSCLHALPLRQTCEWLASPSRPFTPGRTNGASQASLQLRKFWRKKYLFLLAEIEKELLVCPFCNLVTTDTD